MTLGFQQIKCGRCSAARIRGLPCPDCGVEPDPREVDSQFTRRRAMIEAAVKMAALQEQDSIDVTAVWLWQSSFFADVAAWISRSLDAFRKVTLGTDDAVQDLAKAIADLAALRRIAANSARRRPFLALLTYVDAILQSAASMEREYIATLTAPTPLQAQRHADRAQEFLDEVVDHGSELSALLDDWARFDDLETVAELVGALLSLAMRDLGTESLLDFAQVAKARVDTLTASDMAMELGIDHSVSDTTARLYLDRARFNELIKSSYSLFSDADQDVIRTLAESPSFMTDMESATLDTFDAMRAVGAILENADVPRQVLRAAVDLASSLLEGPGQFVSAALLFGLEYKTRPYEALRGDNATELVRKIQGLPDEISTFARGLDVDLRTAKAHSSVRYGDEGTVTTDTKSGGIKTVNSDDLIDGIYEAVESLFGCLLGLRCALSGFGLPVGGVKHLSSIGISPVESLHIVGSSLIGPEVGFSADVDGATLTVVLSRLPGVNLLTLMAGLVPYLPDEIEDGVIIINGVDDQLVFAGPVTEFRVKTSGFDNLLQTVRISRSWTDAEGTSVMSDGALNKWIAVSAMQLAVSGYPECMTPLRALRSFVAEQGYEDIAEVLTGLLRYVRLNLTGGSEPPHSIEALQALVSGDVRWAPGFEV